MRRAVFLFLAVIASALPLPGMASSDASLSGHELILLQAGNMACWADGVSVTLASAPFMNDGQLMVSAAELGRLLGCGTEWDPSRMEATLTRREQGVMLRLTAYAPLISVNGSVKLINAPPVFRDGVLMLPAAPVASALGYSSVWDAQLQSIALLSGGPPLSDDVFAVFRQADAAERLAAIEKEIYGFSGKGRELICYRVGSPDSTATLLCVFALHGFEDAYDRDGRKLTDAADSLLAYYGASESRAALKDFCLMIIPCANPDGALDGWTRYGPGRCQVSMGIDLNRDFPRGHMPRADGRNKSPSPLSAPESKALAALIREIQPSALIDFHGWAGKTIGDETLCRLAVGCLGLRESTPWSASHGGFLGYWADGLLIPSMLVEYRSPEAADWRQTAALLDAVMDALR